MKRTILLTRMLLKTGGGQKQSKLSKFAKFAVIMLLLALIPIGFGIVVGLLKLYDILATLHMEHLLLGMGLGVTCLAIFFFGIFYVINVFYLSKDIDHLLPLPLTPTQILTAKFSVTLLWEYITVLIFLMPILITYGVKSGAGIIYYLYSVVIFLLLPIIPLIVASILAMIIMRFTNISKKKDLFRIIGGAAAVILGLGTNVIMRMLSDRMIQSNQWQEMLSEESIIGRVSGMFPSTKIAATALLNYKEVNGLLDLLLFIAITCMLYFVFVLLGEWLYMKGVMGVSEASSKRSEISGEQLTKLTTTRSVLSALTSKELKLLFRTPACSSTNIYPFLTLR